MGELIMLLLLLAIFAGINNSTDVKVFNNDYHNLTYAAEAVSPPPEIIQPDEIICVKRPGFHVDQAVLNQRAAQLIVSGKNFGVFAKGDSIKGWIGINDHRSFGYAMVGYNGTKEGQAPEYSILFGTVSQIKAFCDFALQKRYGMLGGENAVEVIAGELERASDWGQYFEDNLRKHFRGYNYANDAKAELLKGNLKGDTLKVFVMKALFSDWGIDEALLLQWLAINPETAVRF